MTEGVLDQLGWGEPFQTSLEALRKQDWLPARVSAEHRGRYELLGSFGECTARVSGRFMHERKGSASFPTVGDWVGVERRDREATGIIHAVLERRTRVSRKSPGEHNTTEQLVAANVDVLFLVQGLDHNLNPRRLERFLAAARTGGARPVSLLNKCDLAQDWESRLEDIRAVCGDDPLHVVSARTGQGESEIRSYLAQGVTAAFLGSSGVGKSTWINRLLGEERQRVMEVRDHDSKGRHTTVTRQLFLLPEGGLVLDTPGIRGLEFWGSGEEAAQTFHDIEELSASCAFRDCRHEREPECAVLRAVEEGTLDSERLASFQRMQAEAAALGARQVLKGRQARRAGAREKAKAPGARPKLRRK